MQENYEINAKIMKSFSDPNRLRILKLLRKKEYSANGLLEELQIGQPTLSHHMKILSDAGMVRVRKEGKWSYYSLSLLMLEEVCMYLMDLLDKEY